MKSCYRPSTERGAVLLVALVMLLVLTLLAISGVREATLESRITANKAHALQLDNASEAALREAEFRYFNPINDRDKYEPNEATCKLTNILKVSGANKPCLLPIKASKDILKEFVLKPIELSEDTKNKFVGEWDALLWMPYRGRDAANATEAEYPAEWNTYLISGPNEETPQNVEYPQALEGEGTYVYLANGKATDEADRTQGAQSSFANVYVGLNN